MTIPSPSHPSSADFAIVNMDLVETVGWQAAGLLARIEFRSRLTGWWRASQEQMAAESGLTRKRLRYALDRLREQHLIECESGTGWDRTMRYRRSAPLALRGQTLL